MSWPASESDVDRAEVPITHLIVRRLLDRSDPLNLPAEIDGGTALARAGRSGRSAAPTRCSGLSLAAANPSCGTAGISGSHPAVTPEILAALRRMPDHRHASHHRPGKARNSPCANSTALPTARSGRPT